MCARARYKKKKERQSGTHGRSERKEEEEQKEEKEGEKQKDNEKKRTRKKLQRCAEDFVAACLHAFTLTFSDTSNLFRGNGEWNIFEVPRRPLARRDILYV